MHNISIFICTDFWLNVLLNLAMCEKTHCTYIIFINTCLFVSTLILLHDSLNKKKQNKIETLVYLHDFYCVFEICSLLWYACVTLFKLP